MSAAETLSTAFELPLRSFRLELELELKGTVALVGPSGAGKTSVLRAVAGLVRPPVGRIALDGDVWLDADRKLFLRPDERRVGLVFQEYALFPHMSVRQNVAYGGRERVDEYLERFRISHLAHARPTELSGGERQRVALARALARDPGVLCWTSRSRRSTRTRRRPCEASLQELLHEFGLPTLLVTHDYEDAASLADQVGVIIDGRLRQLGPPQELVAHPADVFVASFTGANVIRGTARPGGGELTLIELESGDQIYSADRGSGPVGVVVYPWEVSIGHERSPDSAMNVIAGEVRSIVHVGNRIRVKVGPVTAEVTEPSWDKLGLGLGGRAVVSFKATGHAARQLRVSS